MIKFNKYHVTDGIEKARCFYSLDNRADRRECVTIFAKDFGHALDNIFPDDYHNDTDMMTDYFDKGHVDLFEDHPEYEKARARAEGDEIKC